ncbi:hypothetical protein [Haloarcula rubripromontorii]|uniref:Uncharacterized protein n=1 Tax=Haloarcula rubripromontorii TaxID=1705562 RepID=A0A0N0BPW3_9EURY|nr:hypothetical protein [Haloarcula rubripromontorii]KOX94544.1 hypothetical protein AMS69_01390 [Haloarcula rubripromontorii]NLV07490.1 hypothetical protein [Haloarcula rubripromontorii]
MDRWVDPDEADPAQWRGRGPYDDLRRGAETVSVLERALRTSLPYQHEVDIHHDDDVAEQFQSSEYEHARVIYNSGVDANRRIKLLTRGVLWGGGETHQRFQAQYRRPPPPAESVPFGEYTVWSRYQYGTIERTDDGLTFTESDETPDESLRELDWGALFDPVQERLAELELVRNPTFGKYRLEELDEWEAYRTRFQYDPGAFAVGP